MKRKLIRGGKYTVVTSLPRNWIEDNNLKKGDDIEIKRIKSYLIIKPLKKSLKIKTLNFKKMQPWQPYYVSSYFQENFDVVKIINIDEDKKHNILDYMWYYPKSKIIDNNDEIKITFDSQNNGGLSVVKISLSLVEKMFELLDSLFESRNNNYYQKIIDTYKLSLQYAEKGTRDINNSILDSNMIYYRPIPQLAYYINLEFRYIGSHYDTSINFSEEFLEYFDNIKDYFLIIKNQLIGNQEIDYKKYGNLKEKVFDMPLKKIDFYNFFEKNEIFYINHLVSIGKYLYIIATNCLMTPKFIIGN